MYVDVLNLVVALLFGVAVGSFLNVVILRLPRPGMSVVFPASHCPICEHDLAVIDNIPVLSYVFLKGKCRYCKTSISFQYPLVEISMAFLSLCIVQKFGINLIGAGYFLFTAILVVIIFIDLNEHIIPDILSYSGCVLGLLFSLINGDISVMDSFIGLVVGALFFLLVSVSFTLVRNKDGLGGGDIKLLAMLGAWLGWQSLPFIIFMSAVSGVIIGIVTIYFKKEDKDMRIPFGPFLSVAAISHLFLSPEIQRCWLMILNLY